MSENREGSKSGDGNEELRFIISVEERHSIVQQFVSDIMRGYRKVDWEVANDMEWTDKVRHRFQIVSGALASTSDDRIEAELELYNDIAQLAIFGMVSGRSSDGVDSEELALLKERIEKTNGAVLSVAKRIGERLEDIDKRLKDAGF